MIPVAANILLEGLWPAAPMGAYVSSVVTDSRQVVAGSVFVAIKGERVDGHSFAAGAIKDGAIAAVVQHPVDGLPAGKTVLVRDPLDAMIAMGANYRRQFKPLVLGVTGSVGKTTCKEFCAAVFSAFGSTLKTEGNQNNEIGLPGTLFRMDEQTSYAVLEMGMQGLGEIHKLTMAARPSAALITKIGTAHMKQLGSVENIRKAKLEICDGLPQGAPLVLNGDDPMLWGAELPPHVQGVYAGIENPDCVVRAANIASTGEGQKFTIVDRQYGSFEVFIPALGLHNVQNALMAYTAATRLGLNAETSAHALANYKTTGMRQNIVKLNDITLIEDCYNANPDSMRAALGTLAEAGKNGRRVAVLGDMLDLGDIGPEAHREVGRVCAETGVDKLYTVGELAALAAEEAKRLGLDAQTSATNADAAGALLQTMQPGDTILLKASRGMRFEEIIAVLSEKLAK